MKTCHLAFDSPHNNTVAVASLHPIDSAVDGRTTFNTSMVARLMGGAKGTQGGNSSNRSSGVVEKTNEVLPRAKYTEGFFF